MNLDHFRRLPGRCLVVLGPAFATLATSLVLAQEVPASPAPEQAASAAQRRTLSAKCPRAEYPQAAARAQAQGTSRLSVEVDAAGKVVSVTVLRRSGDSPEHRLLDRAAVDLMSQCQFDPSESAGTRSFPVEHAWRLEGSTAGLPPQALKEDAARTGSMIRREVVRGSLVPFAKRYEELSSAERAVVRSWYDNLAEGDEPPYPAAGTANLYRRIADMQSAVPREGLLSLFVTIDADGKPTNVSVMATPDMDVARYVAKLLLQERYKPARCGGQPCEMQFPVRVQLKTSGM